MLPIYGSQGYIIIQDLLDEMARPAIPTATITASASLSTLGAGNNGGINIETFPPCSDFDVVGQFDSKST